MSGDKADPLSTEGQKRPWTWSEKQSIATETDDLRKQERGLKLDNHRLTAEGRSLVESAQSLKLSTAEYGVSPDDQEKVRKARTSNYPGKTSPEGKDPISNGMLRPWTASEQAEIAKELAWRQEQSGVLATNNALLKTQNTSLLASIDVVGSRIEEQEREEDQKKPNLTGKPRVYFVDDHSPAFYEAQTKADAAARAVVKAKEDDMGPDKYDPSVAAQRMAAELFKSGNSCTFAEIASLFGTVDKLPCQDVPRGTAPVGNQVQRAPAVEPSLAGVPGK